MEKTEVVAKLKKSGYQVQFDSSVVTVVLPAKVNVNQELKKLKYFFEEIGYDSSFGIKQSKKSNGKEPDEIVEQTEVRQEINEFEMVKEKVITDSDFMEEEPEVLEIGEQFSLEDFGIS